MSRLKCISQYTIIFTYYFICPISFIMLNRIKTAPNLSKRAFFDIVSERNLSFCKILC